MLSATWDQDRSSPGFYSQKLIYHIGTAGLVALFLSYEFLQRPGCSLVSVCEQSDDILTVTSCSFQTAASSYEQLFAFRFNCKSMCHSGHLEHQIIKQSELLLRAGSSGHFSFLACR